MHSVGVCVFEIMVSLSLRQAAIESPRVMQSEKERAKVTARQRKLCITKYTNGARSMIEPLAPLTPT
jgi:hypothetical protein